MSKFKVGDRVVSNSDGAIGTVMEVGTSDICNVHFDKGQKAFEYNSNLVLVYYAAFDNRGEFRFAFKTEEEAKNWNRLYFAGLFIICPFYLTPINE